MANVHNHVTEKHYVDNVRLHTALSNWVTARQDAISSNQPIPPLPDYVGECAMMIAERWTRKQNFVKYTYREDMQSEAVLAICKYVHNYNPAKTTNAFAYMTQIIHNACLRTIQTEQVTTYRHMFLSETAVCSHPNYQRLQQQLNAEHEGYSGWRAGKIRPRRKRKRVDTTPSGIRGVHQRTNGTWSVTVCGVYCGVYQTLDEARLVVEARRAEHLETKRQEKAAKMPIAKPTRGIGAIA